MSEDASEGVARLARDLRERAWRTDATTGRLLQQAAQAIEDCHGLPGSRSWVLGRRHHVAVCRCGWREAHATVQAAVAAFEAHHAGGCDAQPADELRVRPAGGRVWYTLEGAP